MQSNTIEAWGATLPRLPHVDLSPLPGKPNGKLRLSPEQLLSAIQGQVMAQWALQVAPISGLRR